MTIAKEFAAKLSVAFVATAMIFSAFASSANAQTTEELQQMINDLLAQVASLQSQIGGSGSTSGSCTTIVPPLTIGSTGADVTALQNRLIAAGQSIPAGATGYFGSQTQAALAAWQAANGVSPAAGYYGPITQAAMDAACTPSDDDEMDDDDSSDMELSGEASLDSLEIDDAEDDELEEGAEDAEIATVTLEFTDGDAEVSRLDIQLIGSGNETDPWDTFEEISLWVDGDMIASANADDEDDYLDEDDGSLRFSNLDLFAEEDEEVEITIAATVQGSVDGTDDGEDWTVEVTSVRYFDADGVATTEEEPDFGLGDQASFTIEEAGAQDELTAKSSTNDPDSSTLQVEDDSDSDWYTVFVFDLDTDDSVNDIELNSIAVNVATSVATYATLVDDAELVIDGTTIDDYDVTYSGNLAVLTFDVDGDVVIDAGDRVEAELRLQFNSLDEADEGATVQGSITSLSTTNVDAEGADDLGNGQLSGAATGEVHTLRTSGIDVSVEGTDATVTVVDGDDNDYGTFEVELEVTAFEQDVFIPINSASTTWKLVDGNGADLVTSDTASTTVVISSSAEEGGAGDAFFQIDEGETETVTVTVTYTPGSAAPQSARLQLLTLVFDEAGTVTGTDDSTWNALPASEYRTATKTIQN